MSGIELFALPAVLGGGSVSLGGALGAAGLAAGTVAGLQTARMQAGTQRAQAAQQRATAAQQRQAGHLAKIEGEVAAAKASDDGRRQRARVFNTLSGSGVDAASGSAAAVMDDLAAGSALDASLARWRGSQAAADAAWRARMNDWQADFGDRQAAAGLRTAWWREGSTLLTGGRRLMAGGL